MPSSDEEVQDLNTSPSRLIPVDDEIWNKLSDAPEQLSKTQLEIEKTDGSPVETENIAIWKWTELKLQCEIERDDIDVIGTKFDPVDPSLYP